jgi:hypothetical protein
LLIFEAIKLKFYLGDMILTIEIASNQHLKGKGHNVKNKNVESLKVDQKFEKDQNLESLFFKLIRTSKMKRLIRTSKIRTLKRMSKVKNDFQCSDFTYGVKKDQNIKNRKKQLPMAFYLCVPRPVGG